MLITFSSRLYDQSKSVLLQQRREIDAQDGLMALFRRSMIKKVDLDEGKILIDEILGRPRHEFLVDIKDIAKLRQMTITDDDLRFRITNVLAPQHLPTLAVFVYDDTDFYEYRIYNQKKVRQ